MKNIKNFKDKFNENKLENDLIRCGFDKIAEDEINNYFDDEDSQKSSIYDSSNYNLGYDFGYITTGINHDEYCIIHLDKKNGDDVFVNEDGSQYIIIKYNNDFFVGVWDEVISVIGRDEDDEFGFESFELFGEFKKEMIKNNVKKYICWQH